MKTEKLVTKISNLSLNIVANEVESLRINESCKNTLRIYENGVIGVAGSIGTADWAALEETARQNLSQGIPYPEAHAAARELSLDTCTEVIAEKEFVPAMKHLLARLSAENPEFLFSNKLQLNTTEATYESSDGENYSYRGNQFLIVLMLKHKGSANIVDESYECESRYFNEDEICRDVKRVCEAFLKPLPHVEEDEVTVIGGFEPLEYAASHLLADLYFNNASLLAGKLGQKLFSEKLTLTVNRDPKQQLNLPFFDAEGVVNEGYVNALVKNGVFERLLTCKRSAEQYHTENLGCAAADYNGVPDAGGRGLDVADTAEALKELVHGRAVYLSATSGGDMTPAGDISLPVLTSYLYEDGELLGKLPEYALSFNLFDVLNENFVGVTEKGLFGFGEHKYLVYRAKIVNKS